MAPVPRRPLDRQFVLAVRASDQSLVTLAALCGYPSCTQLCVLLNGKRIILTPLAVARLRTLACVVNYTGYVFQPEARRG